MRCKKLRPFLRQLKQALCLKKILFIKNSKSTIVRTYVHQGVKYVPHYRYIGNEESKDRIIEITASYSLYAPVSVHWEIGNAFSAMFKRQKTDIELAKLALKAYHEISIKFIDVPLERALELSYSLSLYAYDAYLIQCAQQTSTSLLMLDKGLKSMGAVPYLRRNS